jgi:hypothetical protein
MQNTILIRISKLSTLALITALLIVSCSKKDTTPPYQGRSKDYKLYNYSSGAAVEAGTFTISELESGNSKLTINLNQGYKVPGVSLKSSITVTDNTGVELVFSNLKDVDGGAGVGETNPVVASGTNATVKYTDLIGKIGYTVKVLNGSNVQAKGTIN